MGSIMPKKIIYWVQRYKPTHEAISKEVNILADHFGRKDDVRIFDLHLDGVFSFKASKGIISHHFAYYPLTFIVAKFLNRKGNLSHIYTSLCDLPYLHIIKKKPIILTAAAPCNEQRLKKKIKLLKRLDKIVVETESDKELLLKYGVSKSKIELVYPPVDLKKFSYKKAKSRRFTILYATCPEKNKDFGLRGFNLIAEAASADKNIAFEAPWRYKNFRKAIQAAKRMKLDNLKVTHGMIRDMNRKYAEADCTIIPYTKKQVFLKQIPNSAVESLAAGKPVLVSSEVGIAGLIKKEKCGIVFRPNAKSLLNAIDELKRNYSKYQKNCLKTARKYFSKAKFINSYEKIYKQVLGG